MFFQKQKRGGRRAVEKAGPWKARKTKSRFSSLPTALGNRAQPARFPLFPQPRLLLVFLPASQLTWGPNYMIKVGQIRLTESTMKYQHQNIDEVAEVASHRVQ